MSIQLLSLVSVICDPSLTQEDWLKRQHFPFCLRCSWKTQLRNFNPHKGEESKKNRTKKLVLIWPLFPWSGDGKRRKGCIGDLLTKDSPSMALHKEQSSCLFPSERKKTTCFAWYGRLIYGNCTIHNFNILCINRNIKKEKEISGNTLKCFLQCAIQWNTKKQWEVALGLA